MKNFYLISIEYNNFLYTPEKIHDIIINTSTVDAWWHNIPGTYIVRSRSSVSYHTDRLTNELPGLRFFIIKINFDEFNGFLPKTAWDWINAHSKNQAEFVPVKLPPLLSDILNAPIPTTSSPLSKSLLPTIDEILKKHTK